MVTISPAAAKKLGMFGRIQVFILFVICLSGAGFADASDMSALAGLDLAQPERFLASVKEFPLFLHKCMATFVSPIALVSTAACLLCSSKCNMFIRVVHDQLEDISTPVYQVRKALPHPKYRGEASNYDVGVILLEQPVPKVKVMSLPGYEYEFSGLPASVYIWHFTVNERKYYLDEKKLKTISNEICSGYLNEYVSNKYMCALGKTTLKFGVFDHGSPLISGGTTLLGIFSKHGVEQSSHIGLYQSIVPYTMWIQNNVEIY